jgi:hypothetical protein
VELEPSEHQTRVRHRAQVAALDRFEIGIEREAGIVDTAYQDEASVGMPRWVDRRDDRRGRLLDFRRDGIVEPDVPQRDRIVGFERDGETASVKFRVEPRSLRVHVGHDLGMTAAFDNVDLERLRNRRTVKWTLYRGLRRMRNRYRAANA